MRYYLSLALVILSGCASSHYVDENSFSKSASVLGMIYDLDRRPVADVIVTLDGDLRVASDVRGRFSVGPVDFGKHRLRYQKEGYEPAELEIAFSEASQNAYIQLASRDQLFDAAMLAIENEHWEAALTFVDRAERFSSVTSTSVLLRAIAAARQQKPLDAVALVEGYLAKNPDQYTLELFLADLWASPLKDTEKSLGALRRAQALRDDAAVRRRIADLEQR